MVRERALRATNGYLSPSSFCWWPWRRRQSASSRVASGRPERGVARIAWAPGARPAGARPRRALRGEPERRPGPDAVRQVHRHGQGRRTSGSPIPSPLKKRISLRVRNFETAKLKVNDAHSNPIEIAAIVVWKVMETAEAMFEVDNYEEYVRMQSESALRALAPTLPVRRAQSRRDCAQHAHRRGVEGPAGGAARPAGARPASR